MINIRQESGFILRVREKTEKKVDFKEKFIIIITMNIISMLVLS